MPVTVTETIAKTFENGTGKLHDAYGPGNAAKRPAGLLNAGSGMQEKPLNNGSKQDSTNKRRVKTYRSH